MGAGKGVLFQKDSIEICMEKANGTKYDVWEGICIVYKLHMVLKLNLENFD